MKLTKRYIAAAALPVLTAMGCQSNSPPQTAAAQPNVASALHYLESLRKKSQVPLSNVPSADPSMAKSSKYNTHVSDGYCVLITPHNTGERQKNAIAGFVIHRGAWSMFYKTPNDFSDTWNIDDPIDQITNPRKVPVDHPATKAVTQMLALADGKDAGISVSVLKWQDGLVWKRQKNGIYAFSNNHFIRDGKGRFLTSRSFGYERRETGFNAKLFFKTHGDLKGEQEYTLVMSYDFRAGMPGPDGKPLRANPFSPHALKFRIQDTGVKGENTAYFEMNPWFLPDKWQKKQGYRFNPRKAGYGTPAP